MRPTVLLAVLVLSACGQAPIADAVTADAPFALNNSTQEIPADVRLPGTPYSLRKPLMELADIKEDGLPFSRRADGFTGGEAMTGRYSNGVVEFFTMPDGGLWKVRLTSGLIDRCGSKLTSEREIREFVRLVTPSADADAIASELVKPMKEGRTENLFRGSIRYGVYNDCRRVLTITEMDALPPEKRVD